MGGFHLSRSPGLTPIGSQCRRIMYGRIFPVTSTSPGRQRIFHLRSPFGRTSTEISLREVGGSAMSSASGGRSGGFLG